MTINRRECKTTAGGMEYAGTQSQTIFGDQCQKWSSQQPHAHDIGIYNHEFPENDVREAKNYCRNVNNDPLEPWCYTTNPEVRRFYFLIPMCSESGNGKYQECKYDRRRTQYRGEISHTVEYHQCLPWTLMMMSMNINSSFNFPDNSIDEV